MEELKCPTCGEISNDGYCSNCMYNIPIPEEQNDGENSEVPGGGEGGDESLPHFSQSKRAAECELYYYQERDAVTCTNCGMVATPGAECPQCGFMIPLHYSEGVSAYAQPIRQFYLELPQGRRIELVDGREYPIGRESSIADIRCSLDVKYVSRRHCTICPNCSTGMVRVKDEGSMNGTFVERGGCRDKVCGETEIPMPADIWLGSHVKISIRA